MSSLVSALVVVNDQPHILFGSSARIGMWNLFQYVNLRQETRVQMPRLPIHEQPTNVRKNVH